MTEHEPGALYASFHTTVSPETGEPMPVILSWWYLPSTDDPRAAIGSHKLRNLIRSTRMDEHLQHHLVDTDGQRTRLTLTGTRATITAHPLATASGDPMPVLDPAPTDFGHAAVHSNTGMYVLVADAQPAEPGVGDLRRLAAADSRGIGFARIDVRADDQARDRYAANAWDWIWEEKDPDLRDALAFLYGIPAPYGPTEPGE